MNFAEAAARITAETLKASEELSLPKPMNVRERFLLYFWLALDMGLVRLPEPGEEEPSG